MNKLKSFFTNLRFKQKLILSYMIISIIPTTILGIFAYNQAKTYLEEKAIEILDDSVSKSLDTIIYKTNTYTNVIRLVALNTKIQQMLSNNYTNVTALAEDLNLFLNPFLNNIENINADIEQITIFAENNLPEYGRYVNSKKKIENTYWFREFEKDENINWFSHNNELFTVKRIKDTYSNKELGILYIALNQDIFFNSLVNDEFTEYGAFVTDTQNNIVFSQNVTVNGKFELPPTNFINKQKGIVKISGEKYILITRKIRGLNWTVYYYTPTRSITIDANKILSATAITLVICTIFIFLIAFLFSKVLSNRILFLNKKIQAVENGNMNIEIHSNYNDEIGELTNRFGRMIKKINTLIEEVYISKIKQKEAELKALQSQINPHFLYNILSIIHLKAVMINSMEISHIATTLSKFYRTILNKGRNLIQISDEIENTKLYTEIQLLAHDYNFDVVFDIDDSILQYSILKLTLQPIVENAIVHGVTNKIDGRGLLKISGHKQGPCIEFTIEDNGPGMDDKTSYEILTKHSKGYGILNVQERIQLFFGNNYGINIKSILGSCTIVKVVIPIYIYENK